MFEILRLSFTTYSQKSSTFAGDRNQTLNNMAKIGYVYVICEDDTLAADKQWMNQYGCVRVIEEIHENEATRPAWHKLLNSLARGDELVLSKFSNAVRNIGELTTLIEFCRVKVIRLISIHDCIDTKNKLFPETTPGDVMEMIGALPQEVAVLRRTVSHIDQLRRVKVEKPPKRNVRQEKEKMIVEMYQRNISIDDIWQKCGFQSRSSIFRILNKYGVTLNRGKFSGPLGPRKKTEEEDNI